MTATATVTTDQDWLLDASLSPDADDAALRPLYEAAGRGELALPFCSACGLPLDLEQCLCDACGSDQPAWRAVEPRGIVHCATLVHRREPGLVRADAPYPVIDVELIGGHRLILTTVLPTSTTPAIGSPVEIGFRNLGGRALPAVNIPQQSEVNT
ncbi:hypothetical protein BH09ACT8_BH09ACT8_34280 [soil metagenome]